jgi:tetratricopeptide (TPR) repeat protein
MEHLDSWGMKHNKKADVLAFLQGIAAANGKNKAFMLQYAALLERSGDQAGSLAAYEKAAHITPDDYQTLQTAAGENAFSGQNENAIKLYKEALDCKTLPANLKVDIQLRMATLYEKIGQKENALQLYKKPIRQT